MEDYDFTRRMRHYFPGMIILEIFHNLHDSGPSYVHVSDYEDQEVLANLVDPRTLLIKEEVITIMFKYPLQRKVSFEFVNDGGFTRVDLFRCIYEGYKKIYETEEDDVGDPGTYEILYNRRESHGTYGIWGHYMADLRIEGIAYDPETRVVELIMGS